jgi:4-amino-4-deoxy-L-arabinose transferase-like glycosyltransferase
MHPNPKRTLPDPPPEIRPGAGGRAPLVRRAAWPAAILALAVLLRVGFVAWKGAVPLAGDPVTYDNIAQNLVDGHGYATGLGADDRHPTAMRGPTYVLLVAGVYALVGHRTMAVYLVQIALDTMACWLVYRLGRHVFGRETVALVAMLLYALDPLFILNTGAILTETFVTTLVLAAILGFLTWTRERRAGALVASSMAIGLLGLSKPNLAPLPFVFFLSAPPAIPRGVRLRALALQVGIVALLFAPWIARNAVVFHAFVPGVSIGGMTFWGGAGPDHGRTLGGPSDPGTPPHVRTAIAGLSEVQRDRWFYGEGVRVIRSAPGRYARLVAKKCVRLWFNLWFDDPPSRASVVLAVANLLAWLAAALGMRAFPAERAASRLLLGLVLFFTVIHVVFFAVVRYALPVYAYLLPFTAAGLVAAASAVRAPLAPAIRTGSR